MDSRLARYYLTLTNVIYTLDINCHDDADYYMCGKKILDIISVDCSVAEQR